MPDSVRELLEAAQSLGLLRADQVEQLTEELCRDGTVTLEDATQELVAKRALRNSPETKSLFSNLAELSMMRDLTQGGDHGRLFGESGTSDDAAVSIVG